MRNSRVVAVVEAGDAGRPVIDGVVSLGRLLRAEPVALALPDAGALAGSRGITVEVVESDPLVALVEALGEPLVEAGVVGGGADVVAVADHSDKPVMVVPADARVTAVRRLVVALDGSCGARWAAARFSGLLRDTVPEIVVVHVFDERTAPRFLDRGERDLLVWQREFVERRTPWPNARLRWATGTAETAGAAIVDAADAEDADAVALGWRQDARRGTTAQDVLGAADVPVLLLPIPRLALVDERQRR